MMPENLILILELLFKIGRPRLIGLGKKDSCILSTLVAIEVLRHFKIEAVPLAVYVSVGNPAFARLVKTHGYPPETDYARLCEKYNAKSIKLGGAGASSLPGWPHHLVAIIEGHEGHLLYDLSIDQADVWLSGTEISPAPIPCDDGFLAGRRKLELVTPSGCYLRYQALPDEMSYRQTPAWTAGVGHFAEKIVGEMWNDLDRLTERI